MRLVSTVVIVWIVLGVATARADEAPPLYRSGRMAMGGQVGIATPVGLIGVVVDIDAAPWFTLTGGVGLGASGLQGAAMPRVMTPISPTSVVYFGAGVSAGRYKWTELFTWDDEAAQKTWDLAGWGNVELGLEARFADVWSARAFIGYGFVLNKSEYTCNNEHCIQDHGDDGYRMPYFGFALAREL